ncbi:hypothetical protein VP01_1080g17 [Puccinia sorghi]|uniref:Uncharacterized protein n=1 Tax=Puccinia sorghi TaxID=27349 RepID=A0A0L6VTD1_9BASI|nr:hypothetical protein VP01_1080g17 [Puccinia sorghi]
MQRLGWLPNFYCLESLQVCLFWRQNHKPNPHKDMLVNHIPLILDQWLTEQVDAGLAWSFIHHLIYTPDKLDVLATESNQFSSLMSPVIRCLLIGPGFDPSPFISLRKWCVKLAKRIWNLCVDVQYSETFLFEFHSSRQSRMILEHSSNMIMIDATHYSVDKYFFSDGRRCNLFAIIIRDLYVGKGVPVAREFTALAAMSVVLKLSIYFLFSKADILSDLTGPQSTEFSLGFDTAQGWYLNPSWVIFP